MIVKLQSLRRFVSSCSGQVVGGYRGGAQLMLGRGRWGMEAARGLILGPSPSSHGITCPHTCTPAHTICSSGEAWFMSLWLMTIMGEHAYFNTSKVDSEPQHDNSF